MAAVYCRAKNGFFRLWNQSIRVLGKSINQPCVYVRHMSFIEEPEYLKYMKPHLPVYELLNVQMKSYDFTVLEHYASYVHKTALNMGIDVKNSWATPHQAWKVTNLKPSSNVVEHEYSLNLYERNIQVSNLPAYFAPLFFEVIQASMPEGLTINFHPHEPEHETIRYIPNLELIELKEQLEEFKKQSIEKKSKEQSIEKESKEQSTEKDSKEQTIEKKSKEQSTEKKSKEQ